MAPDQAGPGARRGRAAAERQAALRGRSGGAHPGRRQTWIRALHRGLPCPDAGRRHGPWHRHPGADRRPVDSRALPDPRHGSRRPIAAPAPATPARSCPRPPAARLRSALAIRAPLTRALLLGAALLAAALLPGPARADFDLSRTLVPRDEILPGGPPKDGIPALTEPRFVPAAEADFLAPSDRVVGVVSGGSAKAYPLSILNWHEIVDDELGDVPMAVTYCPLTGSAVVFDRRTDAGTVSFGVSGRLYQSNVLMYDHQSGSLWSQLGEKAVTGRLAGTGLRRLPAVETTWEAWRREHPDTLVLSRETGYRRPYDRDPYAAYRRSSGAMFPTRPADVRLPMKTWVLGVSVGDDAVAYPLDALRAAREIEDTVGGRRLRIAYDPETTTARATTPSGEAVPATRAYWFAWVAFHPKTRVWKPGAGAGGTGSKAAAEAGPTSP